MRNYRKLFWTIAALALLWRFAAAWELAHGAAAGSVFAPSQQTDLATYMELARRIGAGDFHEAFYYQPFYYAVFLPLCDVLGGGAVAGVVGIQALLSAATAVLAGWTAGMLAGKRAALVALTLTGGATALVFYVPYHQIATLQSFNLALLAYVAVCAVRRRRWGDYLAVGAVAGVAMLTRGNILLVFPPLLLVLALAARSWRRAGFALALAVGAALAVEAPFIVYNSVKLGRLAGPSTAADAVLALGNTPEAPPGGRDPGLPAGPMEYPQAYHEWLATADGQPVIGRIFQWLCAEPGAFLELTFRKLLLFWDYREIPNNVALAGEGATSFVVTALTIPSGLIIALGLAGMLLTGRRMWKRRDWALAAVDTLVIFFWGATAAFYNLSRFRAPVLPLLAVLAGVAVAILARRDWRYRRTFGALALALGVFVTFGSYELYRTGFEAGVVAWVRPDGTRLALNNGQTAVFDHGPMTFGGWRGLAVKPGDVMAKRFAGATAPKPGAPGGKLRLNVQAGSAGTLELTINGRPEVLGFTRGEYRVVELPLPEGFGGELQIAVHGNSAAAMLIIDAQRNYGRTRFNGRKVDGELVSRIIF